VADQLTILLGDHPLGRIRIHDLIRRLDAGKTEAASVGFGDHIPANPEQPGDDPIVVVPVVVDASYRSHHRLAHRFTTGVEATQAPLGEGHQLGIGQPVDVRPGGLVPSSSSLDENPRRCIGARLTPGLVSRYRAVTYRWGDADIEEVFHRKENLVRTRPMSERICDKGAARNNYGSSTRGLPELLSPNGLSGRPNPEEGHDHAHPSPMANGDTRCFPDRTRDWPAHGHGRIDEASGSSTPSFTRRESTRPCTTAGRNRWGRRGEILAEPASLELSKVDVEESTPNGAPPTGFEPVLPP
jgi:hypothetical protein